MFNKGKWQEGLRYSEKADQNDAELLFRIGTCYDIGFGNPQKAFEYFYRAAAKGQMDAQCELGRMYESGNGVGKDIAEAKRWYQAAAIQGSKNAENALHRLEEAEKLEKIKREVSASRVLARSTRPRTVSLEGKSSIRFRQEDAETIKYLKFPSGVARAYYEKACELAKKGSSNRGRANAEYNQGRVCGGPVWPELEAWLNWWK